jgi:hypothetical protein
MKITTVYSENLIKSVSTLYGRNAEPGPVNVKVDTIYNNFQKINQFVMWYVIR